MLKCFFMRNKLYDYINNSLSEVDKIRIKEHLDSCHNCVNRVSQLKAVLDLAAQKKLPELPEEFWNGFRIDLDRRLNQKLVSWQSSVSNPVYFLKPAFTYALILIFVIGIGSYYYSARYTAISSVKNEEDLINEVVVLDELNQGLEVSPDKDSYIEEIDLLYQFGQNLT